MRQIDHWITNDVRLFHDSKVTTIGVDSDHSAFIAQLALRSKEAKKKDNTTTLCHQLLQVKEVKEKYNKNLTSTFKKSPSREAKNQRGPNLLQH